MLSTGKLNTSSAMTNLQARRHEWVLATLLRRRHRRRRRPSRSPRRNRPRHHTGSDRLASVAPLKDSLRTATDDWPFLYLREPNVPTSESARHVHNGGLALLHDFLFLPRRTKLETNNQDESTQRQKRLLNLQLFFLGAGFMLIETKAVVTMALLSAAPGWSTPSYSRCAGG